MIGIYLSKKNVREYACNPIIQTKKSMQPRGSGPSVTNNKYGRALDGLTNVGWHQTR